MSAGVEWDGAARILELREERERLEVRLAEITSDIDREVVGMLRAGVAGQRIAEVCGWSKQRVSQIRARALPKAEPEMGPGEAELALHRREIAAKGGRASQSSRRSREDVRALLDAFGIEEGCRADALRYVARQVSHELRPRSREEALGEWVALRAERRELIASGW